MYSRGFNPSRGAHSARMVNDRFPARPIYGFEMVDAPIRPTFSCSAASIENLRRIESFEISANFRRIYLNANTCDLSTADSQEQTCGLEPQTKRDDRGREMFFLLRMIFWLGLVLVLLPRDKTFESEKLPQIGASEAVSAATAAVSDMGQFCKRQPAACEVGGQAATVLGQRAQDGARKLYQIITDKPDKKTPDHTGSIGGPGDAEATLAEATPRDTLTQSDLAAEWRGTSAP
jgi:hypothetical protein